MKNIPDKFEVIVVLLLFGGLLFGCVFLIRNAQVYEFRMDYIYEAREIINSYDVYNTTDFKIKSAEHDKLMDEYDNLPDYQTLYYKFWLPLDREYWRGVNQ